MSITIFSVTGCVRCNIAKQYMRENGQTYDEYDAMGEGKEEFKVFYKENRPSIFRGPEGVEFPVFTDGKTISQGLAMVMGWLMAKDELAGFFCPGTLHGDWVDGIRISDGNKEQAEKFLEVLSFIKGRNFKIEILTNGMNADLLEKVQQQGLADRVVMQVKGPVELLSQLEGREMDLEEVKKSLSLLPKFPEFELSTDIAPILRTPGDSPEYSFITPEEVAEIAKLIQEATGNKTLPFVLKPFDPKAAKKDKNLKGFKELAQPQMFKYRTLSRRYLPKTDIQKG